jgi:sugar phosphate isomerase/epimerase
MTARIGLQLYTLREEAARDMVGVLEFAKEVGFVAVEPAGFGTMSAAAFAAKLKELDLEAPSAHVPMRPKGEIEPSLEEAAQIGARWAFVSMPKERFISLDSTKRAAEELNAARETASSFGIDLGYHNHWWEFDRSPDGQVPYRVFLAELDPATPLEVDIYWVRTGGEDPALLLAELGDRVTHLHVKDGPANTTDPNTAVGEGVVDIAGAVSATPASWHIVELDRCSTDMREAVRKSYQYLVAKKLSEGRRGAWAS